MATPGNNAATLALHIQAVVDAAIAQRLQEIRGGVAGVGEAAQEATGQTEPLEAALQGTGQAADDAAQAMQRAGQAVSGELAEGARSAGVGIGDLEAALKRVGGQTLGQVQKELEETERDLLTLANSGVATPQTLERAFQRYQQAATQAGVSTEDMVQRVEHAVPAANQLAQGVRSAGDETTRAGRAAQQSGQLFDDFKGKAIDAGKNLLGIFAAGAIAQRFVEVNSGAQQLRAGLETVTGSSEDAERQIAFLEKTADKLGVRVSDLTGNFLGYSAAAKSAGFNTKEANDIYTSVSRALGGVGASSEQAQNAMQALTQMMGDSTIQSEELRGQLAEALPVAMQEAADAMLTNVAGLRKMLEAGEVVTKDFLPAFAHELDKTFAKGTGRVESFAASMARLQNQMDASLKTLGDTGAFDILTEGAKLGTMAVGTLAIGLDNLGKHIGALSAASTSLDFSGLGEEFGRLDQESAAAFDALQDRLYGAGAAAEEAGEAVGGIGTAADESAARLDSMRTASAQAMRALSKDAQEAIADLAKTRDTAAGIEAVFEALGDSGAFTAGAKGVLQIVEAMDQLGKKSFITGEDIENGLGAAFENLTAKQLQAFQQRLTFVFDSGLISAEQFKTLMDGAVSASFEKLGLSAEAAAGEITDAGQEIIAALTSITEHGTQSAEAIQKAFLAAIPQAETAADLKEIEALYVSWAEKAGASVEKVKEVTVALDTQIGRLKDTTDTLEKALSDFGLKSKTDFEQAAAAAKTTSETIIEGFKSQAVSIGQAQKAVLEYAEAEATAAAASGRAIDPLLQQQAALVGLSAEVKKLADEKKHQEDANTVMIDGLKKATEALKGQEDQTKKTAEAATEAASAGTQAADAFGEFAEAVRQANQPILTVRTGVTATKEEAELLARHFSDLRIRTGEWGAMVDGIGQEEMQRLLDKAQALDDLMASLAERQRELAARQAEAAGDTDRAEALRQENALLAEQAEIQADIARARALGDQAALGQAQAQLDALIRIQQQEQSRAAEAERQAALAEQRTAFEERRAEIREQRDAAGEAAAEQRAQAQAERAAATEAAQVQAAERQAAIDTGRETRAQAAHQAELSRIEEREARQAQADRGRERAAAQALEIADAISAAISDTPEDLGRLVDAAQPFVRRFNDAAAAADDLAKTVHDRLGEAIQSAIEKMREMVETARQSADAAERELERVKLQGDDAALKRLDLSEKLDDLEKRRQNLQRLGDADALAAIDRERRAVEERYRLEIQRIEEKARAEQKAANEKAEAERRAAAEEAERADAQAQREAETTRQESLQPMGGGARNAVQNNTFNFSAIDPNSISGRTMNELARRVKQEIATIESREH